MLRIHFTAEDLARVRLAAGPDPLWEIQLSLHKLRDGAGGLIFDGWRRRTRPRLRAGVRWLLDMTPPRGYCPDFMTPAAITTDLDCGLDTVLSTPGDRIRADLIELAGQQTLNTEARELADVGRGALRRLEWSVRDYHGVGIAPIWPRIEEHVHADLAFRARTLAGGGLEALMTGLHPEARWTWPVLEIPYPVPNDLHLDGRGLVLLPSFFCWRQPMTFKDPTLAPVLAYPIEHDLTWLDDEPGRAGATSALLGRTRAAVLSAVAERSRTTTELAERTGVSLASASQHAAVLRDSGLITTRRNGTSVIHSITPLGRGLVDAGL